MMFRSLAFNNSPGKYSSTRVPYRFWWQRNETFYIIVQFTVESPHRFWAWLFFRKYSMDERKWIISSTSSLSSNFQQRNILIANTEVESIKTIYWKYYSSLRVNIFVWNPEKRIMIQFLFSLLFLSFRRKLKKGGILIQNSLL